MKILFLLFIPPLFFLGITCDFVENDVLFPSNGSENYYFGRSVALSFAGSRALVGATRDDTAGINAGAAYVFDVNPSNSSDWMIQTVLYPSNGAGQPWFGFSVAISSDGSRALVGAYEDVTVGFNAGAAYVFDVNPSNSSDWMIQTVLYPSSGTGEPRFGISVALSSDGSRALVGARGDDTVGTETEAGAVYVFDVNPSNSSDWMEQTILYPSNGNGQPRFGHSVALSSDGSRALVGAYRDDTEGDDAGAAYVFDVNPSNASDWMEQAILYPSNGNGSPRFGHSVALSSDGSRALVGANLDDTVGNNAGAAYVFDVNPSNSSDWMIQTVLYPSSGTGSPRFGISVAISSDGTRALVGADGDDAEGTNAGAAYVFDVNPSNSSDWMLQPFLYPSDGTGTPQFGWSVALSSDGARVLVGAFGDDTEGTDAGAAYVFDACPGGSIINENGTACVTIIGDQTITISDNETLIIDGDLDIQSNASIILSLNGPIGPPFIVVSGCASFGGSLTINVSSILDGDEDETIDVIVATYAGGLCPNFTAFDEIVIEGSKCEVVVDETYGETSLDVLITTDSGGCSGGSSSKDNEILPIILGSAGASLVLCCAVGVLLGVVCLCGTSACLGAVVVPPLRRMRVLKRFQADGGAVNFDIGDEI